MQTDSANCHIEVWRQRAWRWNGSSHVLESTTTHVFDTLNRPGFRGGCLV